MQWSSPHRAASCSFLLDASPGNEEHPRCDERIAKGAMARKLAVRLYRMWRKQFARGTARKSSGREVDHRANDWASLDRSCDRRDGWVELNWARDDYKASLGLVWRVIQQNKMMRSRSAGRTTSKQSLTQPTLLEKGLLTSIRFHALGPHVECVPQSR